jgi:hypothetical protein
MANRRSRTGKPAQAVAVLVGLLDTGDPLPHTPMGSPQYRLWRSSSGVQRTFFWDTAREPPLDGPKKPRVID